MYEYKVLCEGFNSILANAAIDRLNIEPAPQTRCWDYVTAKTGAKRDVCKSLIFAMIYGGPVIKVCKRHGLTMDSVVDIRCAFDDYIEGRAL